MDAPTTSHARGWGEAERELSARAVRPGRVLTSRRPLDPPTPPVGAGGADTVAWKINRETVVLLGWGAAVLMQLAHPLVAAGVAEHSLFVSRPGARGARMRATVEAMIALTFGTQQEVERTARIINSIHDRVQGRLSEGAGVYASGTRYSAHDPELLTWVQVTLLDVLPRAYELAVGPLTPEEGDRYCEEAWVIGPLLGFPEEMLPRSRRELDDYMGDMLRSGRLVVTPAARMVARQMFRPFLGRVGSPFYWPMRLWTLGLLPPAFRRAYGFPWDASHERALWVSSVALRAVVPALPGALRAWPAARRAEAGARSLTTSPPDSSR